MKQMEEVAGSKEREGELRCVGVIGYRRLLLSTTAFVGVTRGMGATATRLARTMRNTRPEAVGTEGELEVGGEGLGDGRLNEVKGKQESLAV